MQKRHSRLAAVAGGRPDRRHRLLLRAVAGLGVSGALAAAALSAPVGTSVGAGPLRVAGPIRSTTLTGSTGPIEGSAIAASPLWQAAGRRMTLMAAGKAQDQIVNKLYSSNWSGLAGTSGPGRIDGAMAAWTVPTVARSSARPRYSASWVGVDGVLNQDLIQTGTAQDTASTARYPRYYGWIEILPGAQAVVTDPTTGRPATVRPGDKMVASVAVARPGEWTIFLQDNTQRWYYHQTFNYFGPGDSAEWIQEAPTVNNRQTQIANFGKVKFTKLGFYANAGNRLAWYSTAMGGSSRIILRQGGKVRAAPSSPLPRNGSTNGQRFTDVYK